MDADIIKPTIYSYRWVGSWFIVKYNIFQETVKEISLQIVFQTTKVNNENLKVKKYILYFINLNFKVKWNWTMKTYKTYFLLLLLAPIKYIFLCKNNHQRYT